MFDKIIDSWNSKRMQQLVDARNIGLYIFAVIVLAITWSGVKAIQSNYQLQKKISTLKQQNTVLQLQNDNSDLQNKYLQTDQYLDLAARQNLGLAAPGEKVLLIPSTTAAKYIDPSLEASSTSAGSSSSSNHRSRFAKNFEAWRDFLLGRKLFNN